MGFWEEMVLGLQSHGNALLARREVYSGDVVTGCVSTQVVKLVVKGVQKWTHGSTGLMLLLKQLSVWIRLGVKREEGFSR